MRRQTEGDYLNQLSGSDRLSFPSFCIYNIAQNQADVKSIARRDPKNHPVSRAVFCLSDFFTLSQNSSRGLIRLVVFIENSTVFSYPIKISLEITYKLISAPCKLTEHSFCTLFGHIPVFFGNVIAMHRADYHIDIRKSHLIQH